LLANPLTWSPLEPEVAEAMLATLAAADRTGLRRAVRVRGFSAALPFYKRVRLVRLEVQCVAPGPSVPDIWALWLDGKTLLDLDGSSGPIHQANESEGLQLTQEQAADYLRFFCFAVRGAHGPFIIVERLSPDTARQHAALAKLIRPLTGKGKDAEGRFTYDGSMAMQDELFHVTLATAPSGEVVMSDDQGVASGVPAEVLPNLPPLNGLTLLQRYLSTVSTSVLRRLVEVLLERALAAQAGHRLLDSFNASVAGRPPMQQFAALVGTAFPVIVIESAIPFVEDVIAEVVLSALGSGTAPAVVHALPTPSDDTVVALGFPIKAPAIVTVPLQTYRSLVDEQRVAFELSSKDLAGLIVCPRLADLPECLRAIADVTLRLPPIDVATLAAIFRHAMRAELPAGWDAQGTHWVKHVLHTDFEHPRRMEMSVDAAFAYIHAQVTERLHAVKVEQSLGLAELHGLGEARTFAQDLIADIHAAIAGAIPWSQVDRGALLVGPPGTGKTTLARAIAKDCGVRFVAASAASWQASGQHLGHHIRAIRSTFAEARQYAPSILFIDEIDTLGNREAFRGDSAQYLTEVVNSVLEQMQGIDPAEPVFVIAATNHEEAVDPALKRSGRLDRVIRIPRPNGTALALIYDHYLAEVGKTSAIGPSIDTRELAGLSLGLTGADVDRVVRGAARRARRERRAIAQNDLLAEITNKPREGTVLRLEPAEVARTAVHETGHALATYLSASAGASIGFVTVVPRADGTLGFVARLPDERYSLTKRDYEQELEIMLAGRAAEELIYGEQLISSGASSDLRAASELATRMVTVLGLADAKRLRWDPNPSVEDLAGVEALLERAYAAVLARLRQHEQRLTVFARVLTERQELTGDEVRRLFAQGESS
jgi:AAA+ superfamily predicted ATPase